MIEKIRVTARDDDLVIARLSGISSDHAARLIAAAPEMLRALQRLVHPMADDDDLAFALDVIAQITGGPDHA